MYVCARYIASVYNGVFFPCVLTAAMWRYICMYAYIMSDICITLCSNICHNLRFRDRGHIFSMLSSITIRTYIYDLLLR